MEISGIVKQVGKTQQVSDKFSKRELILKTDIETKYPQYLLIQFTQKNCDKLDTIQPGEVVTVSINLRGREYTDKQGNQTAFNTLEGWRIVKDGVKEPEQIINEQNGDNDLPY